MNSAKSVAATEIPTTELLKKIAGDLQDLVSKEAALVRAESSLAVRAEVDAVIWVGAALSFAVIGATMALTAIVMGLFGWKCAALVGVVILALSAVPAQLAVKRHRKRLIPHTTDTLMEDARWVKEALKNLR